MTPEKIQPVKGTRDFYPEDMALLNWIVGKWHAVSRRYGFEEYEGPVLEHLELYVRKSGEEIEGQIYSFEDKGGRKLALRPETTETLARMIAARGGAVRTPVKWYSVSRCFRYERPQRGRLREFFQWNLDILGVDEVVADAEVIAASADGMREVGLSSDDVSVRIGDRRLLGTMLRRIGVSKDAVWQVYAAIDRSAQVGAGETESALRHAGMTPAQVSKLMEILECEDLGEVAKCQAASGVSPEAFGEMEKLLSLLAESGVGEFCVFDPRLVRGLAYYTGIVFEIYDIGGEFRAICGGGRYADLVGKLGGRPMPGVGFGLGAEVLEEILRKKGKIPELGRVIDYFVVPVSEDELGAAVRTAQALRRKGLTAEFSMRPGNMKRAMRDANESGAKAAVIIGPDEVAKGCVTVRDMNTGVQEEIPLKAFVEGAERPGWSRE